MTKHILRCPNCKTYTMKQTCTSCGAKTETVIPPKYSPEDRMGKYRRMAKKQLE